MATDIQIRVFQMHKRICQRLGIPQAELEHRHLGGSIGSVTQAGNRIFSEAAPQRSFDPEIASKTMVWFVYQSFIRGEERSEQYAPALVATPLQEGQCPAIDDNYELVPLAENDFVKDAQGNFWRIMNPVLDPAGSFWSFLIELQR